MSCLGLTATCSPATGTFPGRSGSAADYGMNCLKGRTAAGWTTRSAGCSLPVRESWTPNWQGWNNYSHYYYPPLHCSPPLHPIMGNQNAVTLSTVGAPSVQTRRRSSGSVVPDLWSGATAGRRKSSESGNCRVGLVVWYCLFPWCGMISSRTAPVPLAKSASQGMGQIQGRITNFPL